MAPTTKTVGKKPLANKGSKNSTKSSSASAKNRISKKPAKPVQQKTKSTSSLQKKKKRKIYTDKELGIPRLNMITPVGVDLPKGKKKGKVFVDDQVGELP
jgi:60S ribosomal subunit assembly/export protein LOC1